MRYNRILCWVESNQKEEFITANEKHGIPIEFTDSLNDLRKNIQENDLCIIAWHYASGSLNEFVKENKNSTFMFHGINLEKDTPEVEHLQFSYNDNTLKIKCFPAEQIILYFLGHIDLIKMNEEYLKMLKNKKLIVTEEGELSYQ
jgi:hypothetical protein